MLKGHLSPRGKLHSGFFGMCCFPLSLKVVGHSFVFDMMSLVANSIFCVKFEVWSGTPFQISAGVVSPSIASYRPERSVTLSFHSVDLACGIGIAKVKY